MRHFKLISLIAFLCCLAVSACSQTATKTPGSTATAQQPATATSALAPATTSLTETPATTPTHTITNQSWQSGPMIAMVHIRLGVLVTPDSAWSRRPSVVIYADGRIIFSEDDPRNGTQALLEGRIDSAELCTLLYDIEDTGFFEFRESDYEAPSITDAGTAHIQVRGWRQNSISAYALGITLNNQDPNEPRQLQETVSILESISVDPVTLYQPEQVIVRAREQNFEITAPQWPLTSQSLTDFFANSAGSGTEQIFAGEEAEAIYELMMNRPSTFFYVDEQLYKIYVRPVLPHETLVNDQNYTPPYFSSMPLTQLTCER